MFNIVISFYFQVDPNRQHFGRSAFLKQTADNTKCTSKIGSSASPRQSNESQLVKSISRVIKHHVDCKTNPVTTDIHNTDIHVIYNNQLKNTASGITPTTSTGKIYSQHQKESITKLGGFSKSSSSGSVGDKQQVHIIIEVLDI